MISPQQIDETETLIELIGKMMDRVVFIETDLSRKKEAGHDVQSLQNGFNNAWHALYNAKQSLRNSLTIIKENQL